MPVENHIGRSEETPIKHAHFKAQMAAHANTTAAILKKYPGWANPFYLYIDINAGDGGTKDDPGSPLIAINILRNTRGMQYRALLIELDEGHAATLERRVAYAHHATVKQGDHNIVLREYIQEAHKPEKTYGLLFADPNGIDPAWDLLADFAEVFPKVDIMIYIAATSLKRVRLWKNNNGYEAEPCLAEHIDSIGKKHWIIREPRGVQQWTFLIGTNWKALPRYEKFGFYQLTAPQGQRVLQKTNYTAEELRQQALELQLELPVAPPPPPPPPYSTYWEYLRHPQFKAVRQLAIERSGGICERCGMRTVTEVHHVTYPAWGTFEDNADGLLAVCHQCHCEIHGKAS